MLIYYPVCTHDLVKAMCCNIKYLISKHSAFPSVIVWVWQRGAWETCTHIIPMPEWYHAFTPLNILLIPTNFASKHPLPVLVVSVISVLVH